MGDRFRIDGHKIQFHPERVGAWKAAGDDWARAKSVYPIYVEVSPSGACNHRCTFCAVDYIGYKARKPDTAMLNKRLAEMAGLGVRSVMFAGEGEPLLNRDIGDIASRAKEAGLDVSFTTNATALSEQLIDNLMPSTLWIKASINAGDAETYAKVHRTKAEHFDAAFKNMEAAAAWRAKHGGSTALGAQMVLLPDNAKSARAFARRAKEAGLDYAVIKPYSQHKSSVTREYEGIDYDRLAEEAGDLSSLDDDSFQVVYRRRTMANLKEEKPYYTKCGATPFFWAYVMADGAVYSCSAYLQDERFLLGNLNTHTFREIWEGEKRRANFAFVRDGLDIGECRKNCRMDAVNRHLWDLEHPPEHVNFI